MKRTTRPSTRKTTARGSQQGHGDNREMSSESNPLPSITRDEMETMMTEMQKKTIAHQEEMIEGFFWRIGQPGIAGINVGQNQMMEMRANMVGIEAEQVRLTPVEMPGIGTDPEVWIGTRPRIHGAPSTLLQDLGTLV